MPGTKSVFVLFVCVEGDSTKGKVNISWPVSVASEWCLTMLVYSILWS